MILLFTDFGVAGPYVGQMRAVLYREAPAGTPVIDLMHDAPSFDPRAASYLLAALAAEIPAGSIVVGVIDPGVGTDREPIILEAEGRWFVGPDNGLFERVARDADQPKWWRITLRPTRLSRSFHGRDLFAPTAARIAAGLPPPGTPLVPDPARHGSWPDDLGQILYVDHYGNAMTGLRAHRVPERARLRVATRVLEFAPIFGAVPFGRPFWYVNSIGLVEIAVNRGRAARDLGLAVGMPVAVDTNDVASGCVTQP